MDTVARSVQRSGNISEDMAPYPFKWVPVSEDVRAAKARLHHGGDTDQISVDVDMVRSVPGDFYMPRTFANGDHERVHDFKFRPDDVVVMTYPKCGTTWTQEMAWQLTHPGGHDTEADLSMRAPFLESGCLPATVFAHDGGELFLETLPLHSRDPIAYTEQLASPRVIKTHLWFDFLPQNLLDTCKGTYT